VFHIELINVQGPGEGGRFDFRQEELVVGSDFGCDLILVHAEVMPQHARIVDEKDGVFLEDLTGRPETKLNGEFISRGPLHNGDELQIGPYVFHITLEVDTSSYGPKGGDVSAEGASKRLLRVLKKPPVLATILLLGILGVYQAAVLITSERSEKDLSALGPVELPATESYGCKVGGKSYIDKVEFTFLGEQPKVRLLYYPGFVRRADSVQIFVNDQRVAFAPAVIDRWSDQAVSLEIPDRVYRMGEVNTVRFDNVRNPPGTERWGVRDVSVLEVPIPKCDIEVAQKYLNLALKRYEEREITESNLYDAIRDLRQGQEYVIACEDPQVKDLLNETLTLYSEELRVKYDASMFNTKKFLKLSDESSARVELERVLNYIPEESDPRHRRAKELLDKLNRAASLRR